MSPGDSVFALMGRTPELYACALGTLKAGMVFTPCIGGISHNEAEDMTKEWAEAGGSVLLHAALELAEVVS